MKEYNPHEIEPRWQAVWEENGQNVMAEDSSKPKKYVLEMFPYPSGDPHMGHARNYSIGDVIARYSKMRGYDVLHPMGWDAFGLPAENAAIKHNGHPATWTYGNIETQRNVFKRMGFSYDWEPYGAYLRQGILSLGSVDFPQDVGKGPGRASQQSGELV